MDSDSIMLEQLGNAVIAMQLRCRKAPLKDWPVLQGKLSDAIGKYAAYQMRLVEEGTIATPQDIEEMRAIKQEIDAAAKTQQLVSAIVRFAGFVASKIT